MVAFLYSIDKAVFLFLNTGVSNPFFDYIMPYVTRSEYWRIPFALAWISLVVFGGRKGRMVAVLVVLTITLSDQMSSAVLKPLIHRVRPCFLPDLMDQCRLLIDQPRSHSFPSSHAANNTALALLLSVKYRRFTGIFVFLAALSTYSRIYVGVHFPSDILGGAVLGAGCAGLILALEQAADSMLARVRTRREAPHKKKIG